MFSFCRIYRLGHAKLMYGHHHLMVMIVFFWSFNMLKFIINALANYEFSFDRTSAYGHVDGYEVNLVNDLSVQGVPVIYFSTFLSQTKKNEFAIKMNARKFPMVTVLPFEFGVAVKVQVWVAKQWEKKIPEVMKAALEILQELEAPKCDVCPQSGERLDEAEAKLFKLPNTQIKMRLTNAAVEAVNSAIVKSNEDFKAAPNNYFKGFLGILLGAIVGVILTVIFSLVGFVTMIAPAVSILLGTFLYKKFGGKPNAVMIVMTFVTTIVVILGVLFLMYIAAADTVCAMPEVQNSIGYYKGMDAFKYCMENSQEFKTGFTLDIVLNIIFILAAEGLSVYTLVRQIRRPKAIA